MFMEQGLVKLITVSGNIQAEMIISTLKANHIPAIKEDLGNAGIMNLYGGNSCFGETIYVAPEHGERAAEILAGMGLGE